MITDRFAFPDWDAPEEERRSAMEAMNAIKLTVEQFERGWAAFENEQAFALNHDPVRYRERPIAALEDFCASEGLLPADVAAAAIIARIDSIVLLMAGAVDLKVEYPETYERCILQPLDPYTFDLFD